MSRSLDRATPSLTRPQQLLTRILDQPQLVSVIQSLPARVLGRVIDEIGLEDAGELVALATTAQLRGIFDDDLWRRERPGRDATFDAERFGLWLAIMMEAGPAFAAEKLAELDEDLVTLALCRLVLVVDVDALAPGFSEDPDDDDLKQTEKALESCLSQEFDELLVIARDPDGWDALVGVLVELDKNHHGHLRRLLERCAAIAADDIAERGLHDVLTAGDSLFEDVAGARDDRRSEAGFVAPSDAAAFLNLARTEAPTPEPDAITRAYFRRYAPEVVAAPAPAPEADRLLELVAAHEAARLGPVAEAAAAEAPLPFQTALAALAPESHARRVQELGYLANVLLAGATIEGREFRPVEAAAAVLAICNLGLAQAADDAVRTLDRAGAVPLFRAGWRRLHLALAWPRPGECPARPGPSFIATEGDLAELRARTQPVTPAAAPAKRR